MRRLNRILSLAATGLAAGIGAGLLATFPAPAVAQTTSSSVALIIANDRAGSPITAEAPQQRDIELVEQLRRVGYQVVHGRNVDASALQHYLEEFKAAQRGAKVAVFYFSGSTVTENGASRLLASGAREGDNLVDVSVPLDRVTQAMTAAEANVVLIDSGYQDPVAEALARLAPNRSVGVASAPKRDRFLFAAASMPGKIARSEMEQSFSRQLIAALEQGKPDWSTVGNRLRATLFEESRGAQLPYLRNDLAPDRRVASLPETAAPASNATPAVQQRAAPRIPTEAAPRTRRNERSVPTAVETPPARVRRAERAAPVDVVVPRVNVGRAVDTILRNTGRGGGGGIRIPVF